MSPGDWCTSAADGPCGAHTDETACRADDRCRGMPYRGESLVACNPDGKGFWSNCPAVGCLARTGAPGQMPSPKVVAQLCRNGVYAKAAAEIVVWRNDKDGSAVLEVRAQDREAGTGRYYYDPDGEPLASTPARELESSDLGRAQAQQRDALLHGLHEAEVTRCGTPVDAKP
jgi:hypothetical protein